MCKNCNGGIPGWPKAGHKKKHPHSPACPAGTLARDWGPLKTFRGGLANALVAMSVRFDVSTAPHGSERRPCSLCGNLHGRAAFSDFQWLEGRLAKCIWCVRGRPQPQQRLPTAPTARERVKSQHRRASVGTAACGIETTHIRQASSGMVTRGDGLHPCTAKWYKDAPLSYEDEGLPIALGDRSLLHNDIKVVEKANKLIAAFNSMRIIADVTLRLATTSVMRIAHGPRAGQHVLVESGVERAATRVNSNSGWSLRASRRAAGLRELPWVDGAHATSAVAEQRMASVLDALSHFSYHHSSGTLLLCNLSACWDAQHTTLTLCDVSLLSRAQTYGPTDLGPSGIANFFGHHVCSGCCRRDWMNPPDASVLFAAEPTSLVERPMGLPCRLTPPSHPRAVRALVAGSTNRGDEVDDDAGGVYFVDQSELLEEQQAWAEETHIASRKVVQAVAWRARAASKAASNAEARRVEMEAAEAARREAFRGINGIDGCIGRQPTTQQPRKTVAELLCHGGTRSTGWRDLPKLEELMMAPNDGTFFQEPEEEEGVDEGE